jgi:hypothetical protein
MRVTIIPDDNTVYVEGQCFLIDCSALREQNIRAVQFYREHGEVEYKSKWLVDEGRYHREPNKLIDSLDEFQGIIDTWHEYKERLDANVKVLDEERQKMLEAQKKALVPPEKMPKAKKK